MKVAGNLKGLSAEATNKSSPARIAHKVQIVQTAQTAQCEYVARHHEPNRAVCQLFMTCLTCSVVLALPGHFDLYGFVSALNLVHKSTVKREQAHQIANMNHSKATVPMLDRICLRFAVRSSLLLLGL